MGVTRKTSAYVVVLVSLLLPIGGSVIAGPASAGTKWTLVDKGSASGANSLANANGEVTNPVKIEVTVTKPALVQWSLECTKGSKLYKSSGKDTLAAAGNVQVKVTKSAANCAIAANALNEGSGTITLSIKSAG
jgi:hypothetical protein